ncbi:hypothetical protein ACFV7Q_09755 [Streptomyces sp. NPDC059851]|uniref:hypothetical protein n=1 Tax=Streptomyces sp. NPDC059851 TaxID=3346971 RepID=UPI003652278C
MTDHGDPHDRGPPPADPAVTFLAAAAALETVDQAVQDAQRPAAGTPTAAPQAGPHPALAALLMLCEVRAQLAGSAPGLRRST